MNGCSTGHGPVCSKGQPPLQSTRRLWQADKSWDCRRGGGDDRVEDDVGAAAAAADVGDVDDVVVVVT